MNEMMNIEMLQMFKVWDLRDQSCIQTIARLQSLGSAPVSIMFYNTHSRCLVMAASQVQPSFTLC